MSHAVPTRVRNVMIHCRWCNRPIDLDAARWCSCDTMARSLRCTTCGKCLCAAPLPYKRFFWSMVPAEIRHDPRRFPAMEKSAAVHAKHGGHLLTMPKVLIVDDDEAIRSLLASFTQDLGYPTQATDDPEEAMRLTRYERIGIVITDAFMPKLDGRELCRRIKGNGGSTAPKVVLMTSLYKALRYRSEAFRAFGVDEYLTKPLDLSVLAATMKRLVS